MKKLVSLYDNRFQVFEVPPHYRTIKYSYPTGHSGAAGWETINLYVKFPYIQFYYLERDEIKLYVNATDKSILSNNVTHYNMFTSDLVCLGNWDKIRDPLAWISRFWQTNFAQAPSSTLDFEPYPEPRQYGLWHPYSTPHRFLEPLDSLWWKVYVISFDDDLINKFYDDDTAIYLIDYDPSEYFELEKVRRLPNKIKRFYNFRYNARKNLLGPAGSNDKWLKGDF